MFCNYALHCKKQKIKIKLVLQNPLKPWQIGRNGGKKQNMSKKTENIKFLCSEFEDSKQRVIDLTTSLDANESLDQKRIRLFKTHLASIQEQIDRAAKLLDPNNNISNDDYIVETLVSASPSVLKNSGKKKKNGCCDTSSRIVEGVFDGEHMIGADGKRYMVPSNYASKSKLVEGDILKLTISSEGGFKYKQISPIERRRVIGRLLFDDESSHYYAEHQGKQWKVLMASITYFSGEHDDEIVFLIPKNSISRWAAVESVIKNGGGSSFEHEEEEFNQITQEDLLEQAFIEGLERVDHAINH